MNLSKKKELARRTLGVGKGRIVFLESRLDDIKEAITKQDIRDLQREGAILIKEIKGRRKVLRVKRKKGPGKIKKRVNTRKREYVTLTRRLRKYVGELKKRGEISGEDFKDTRKKIRNKFFKSKSQLKSHIGGIK